MCMDGGRRGGRRWIGGGLSQKQNIRLLVVAAVAMGMYEIGGGGGGLCIDMWVLP